jgi:hypothetical protein
MIGNSSRSSSRLRKCNFAKAGESRKRQRTPFFRNGGGVRSMRPRTLNNPACMVNYEELDGVTRRPCTGHLR